MPDNLQTVEPDGTLIVRCSSLSIAADCFRRNAARSWPALIESYGYTLRRTGTHVGAAVGRAIHSTAEVILQRQLAGKEAFSRGDVAQLASGGLGLELEADAINFDEVTPGANDADRQVRHMAATYASQVATRFVAEEVETRLEAVYRPGYVLSGQKDVLALGAGGLRDLKTGRKRSNNAAQLGGYLILLRANQRWRDVKRLVEDFVQRAKKPIDAVEIDYSPEDAIAAARGVLAAVTSQVDAFRKDPSKPWAFPANPRSMLCSDRHCPAFGTNFCKEGRPL